MLLRKYFLAEKAVSMLLEVKHTDHYQSRLCNVSDIKLAVNATNILLHFFLKSCHQLQSN